MLGNFSVFSFLRSWKLICCPTTCLLNSNCTTVHLLVFQPFKLLFFWRLRLGLTLNWPTMRFCFLFCFVFVFLKKSPELRLTFLIGWTFHSYLIFAYQLGGGWKKKYRVLAGVPSSLSSRARIRLTLPLLLVTPAMQAMTFPVKRVSSAKLTTLKLNTDQNLMSSICESNIVIIKSQLVSMLLMSCSLLGSTVMVSTKPLWVDLVVVLDTFPAVLMKRACDWVESFPEFLDFCWLSTWWTAQSLLRFFFNSWYKTRCFRVIIIRWIRIFSSTSSWNGEDCIRDICIHFQAIFGNEKNNQDEKMYFVANREKRQSLGGGVQIIFPSL